MKRIAVVKHQGGAGGQGTDQPVPHHPAAGGEVKDRVLTGETGMQDQFFEMMDQDAAGTLHHAFGQAGGARGIHHVEGVIKRQLLELDLQTGFRGLEVIDHDCLGDGADVRTGVGVGHHHQLLNGWNLANDVGDTRQ